MGPTQEVPIGHRKVRGTPQMLEPHSDMEPIHLLGDLRTGPSSDEIA